MAVVGVGVAVLAATLPLSWCSPRQEIPVLDIKGFLPNKFPNAPAQAREFAERIKAALTEGKPVIAWVKVNHELRENDAVIDAKKVPNLMDTIDLAISESQFEAAWALSELPGPRLFVSEGAKSIEGRGSTGAEIREVTKDIIEYFFRDGLPRDFASLDEKQRNFLHSPGASAVAFGLGRFDHIYPAGDERTLDAIDEKLLEIEAKNGGVLPYPYSQEAADLIYRQREEELVRYLKALVSRPENAGKVVALEYGRKHQELKDRLVAAGFTVVELDCGTVLDQFMQNVSNAAKGIDRK